VTGEAEAQVKQMKETAKSSIYKMKLDVFGNDGKRIPSVLRWRISSTQRSCCGCSRAGRVPSGRNMDGKGVNLLLQTPGANGRPTETASPASK